MKIPGPYVSSYGSDSRYCVEGPGHGFGYHAGTLWPECRLTSEEDADAAAILCNVAYNEGYKKAQRDIMKAIGVGT